MDVSLRPVAAEALKPVLIEFDAKTRSGGHREAELTVVERLSENFLAQEQGAEELSSPLELGERREEMRGGDCTDTSFKHRPTIKTDSCGLGDGGDPSRCEKAPRLGDLDGKDPRTGDDVRGGTLDSRLPRA